MDETAFDPWHFTKINRKKKFVFFFISVHLSFSQINPKIGTYGMRANLMTVIRRLAYHFQKRFFVLEPLWTTITTLFARTSFPGTPSGVALLEDSFMTHQVKLPKMVGWKPCWMSVPTQRSVMADSRLQKNCESI